MFQFLKQFPMEIYQNYFREETDVGQCNQQGQQDKKMTCKIRILGQQALRVSAKTTKITYIK
jgi:hypothetical protein